MVEIFFCKREVLKRIYSFILTRTIHPNLATLQQASGYTTGIQQLLRSVTQPEEYSLYFRVSRDACSKEYWRYILFSNFFKLVNSTDSRKSVSRATRRLARFLFALFQSFSFFVFIVKIVNWKRKKKPKQNKTKKKSSQSCRKNWCRCFAWSGWWTVLIQGSALWGRQSQVYRQRHGCADLQTSSVILSTSSCALLGVCAHLFFKETIDFPSVHLPIARQRPSHTLPSLFFFIGFQCHLGSWRRPNWPQHLLEDIENYSRVSYSSIHHGEWKFVSFRFPVVHDYFANVKMNSA